MAVWLADGLVVDLEGAVLEHLFHGGYDSEVLGFVGGVAGQETADLADAEFAGLPHGCLGSAAKLGHVVAVLGRGGEADADAHADGDVADDDGFDERGQEPGGEALGLGGVADFAEEDLEVVAGGSSGDVAGADVGLDALGDGLEALVAGVVAVGVVDGLEVAEADAGEGYAFALLLAGLEEVVFEREEAFAGVQAGQVVVGGLVGKAFEERLAGCYVDSHDQTMILSADDDLACLNVYEELGAIFSQVRGGDRRAWSRLDLVQYLGNDGGIDEIVQAELLEFFQRVAVGSSGGLVGTFEFQGCRIHDPHHVRAVGEERLEIGGEPVGALEALLDEDHDHADADESIAGDGALGEELAVDDVGDRRGGEDPDDEAAEGDVEAGGAVGVVPPEHHDVDEDHLDEDEGEGVEAIPMRDGQGHGDAAKGAYRQGRDEFEPVVTEPAHGRCGAAAKSECEDEI